MNGAHRTPGRTRRALADWSDRPRGLLAALAVCAVTCGPWAPPARAHIAPAVDDNNRYLRVSPGPDRIRLAYTVYIGEVPGARARKRMDGDGDGALADAETRAYRDELAAGVASALEIAVDGAPWPSAWSEVHLGLGTPATNAGSFSVDLIAWLCLPPGREHRLTVRDRFALPRPGETELTVQASPGVKVISSRTGVDGASQLSFQWRGGDTPLATAGWELAFEVLPAAAREAAAARAAPGDPCHGQAGASAEGTDGGRRALAIGFAAALAAILAVAIVWLRRRPGSESGRA